MDLKQARITLDKINALFNSLERDAENVSAIERDLMRGYVQQFYEYFIGGRAGSNSSGATARDKQPARRNYTPPRIIEIPDSLREPANAPKPDPTRRPNPQPRPEPNPRPKPEPEPKPDPRPAPQPPRPEPQPEPEKPDPAGVQTPTVQRPPRTEVPDKLKPLFAHKEAKELSEKLSERPIQDLTKALAINDRLLYMNELFGHDLNALNDTLSRLNQLNNMEAAQRLLVQMAERYHWEAEEKEETARDFIRFVRRKYQA